MSNGRHPCEACWLKADSKRDAITTAAGAIDPTREAVLDYDFCPDVPTVEISEHQLDAARRRIYPDDAAKPATRH